MSGLAVDESGAGFRGDKIAGQERTDDETRFREDHDEQDRVDPGAVLRGERGDGLVQRQQRIEEQIDDRRAALEADARPAKQEVAR